MLLFASYVVWYVILYPPLHTPAPYSGYIFQMGGYFGFRTHDLCIGSATLSSDLYV